MAKSKLKYSELTDSVFIVGARGEQEDVTQQFLQMLLLWCNNGAMPKEGDSNDKYLKVNGKPHWMIRCERIAKDVIDLPE